MSTAIVIWDPRFLWQTWPGADYDVCERPVLGEAPIAHPTQPFVLLSYPAAAGDDKDCDNEEDDDAAINMGRAADQGGA